MRAIRANTIPETAFVISLVLTMLFGVMQYALLGFNQVSADGATFVGNHSAVAYYSAPDSTKAGYVKQAGQAVFQHALGMFNAQIPRNGAYQVDYSGKQTYTNSDYKLPFVSLLPDTLTTTSHIIEPSSNTGNTSPMGDCVTGLENTGSGAINGIAGTAVGLAQPVTVPNLFNVVGVTGTTTISLNPGALDPTVTAAQTVASQLQAIAAQLSLLSKLLDPVTGTLKNVPGISAVENTISTTLFNEINLALQGKLTTTAANNANQTINAATGLLGPLVTPLLTPLLSPIQTQLSTLNNAITTIDGMDPLAPTVCPS